jgi:ribonuclease P protein component
VYRDGVRVIGRHLVVFLMRADGHEGRFGVTASRRVGGAVVRTRCKRRLRELYRTHRQELQHSPMDIVINARRSSASAPWADLERDFMECARRGLEKVARTQNQSLVARPG